MRSRYRASLPDLQHKLDAVREQEQIAAWEQEYLRVEQIRDAAAAEYAELPKLIDRIIEPFQLNEEVDKLVSNINRQNPGGYHGLVGAELKARGLDAYSSQSTYEQRDGFVVMGTFRTQTMATATGTFAPIFTGVQDDRYSANWGKVAESKRHAADAKIDRELELAEQQKREFYRGR